MNFEDARAAIYSRLNTSWSAGHAGMVVQYENRLQVDLSQQVDPFISCEVLFTDGAQKSMELTPLHRYYGAAYLSVWVKQGEGTAEALTLLSELADLFESVAFSGVQTQVPLPLPARDYQGWHVQTVRAPFYFDDRP